MTVADPDLGDEHTLNVSDSRFEVAKGVLKLKTGVALNFEAEPSVTIQLTAFDSGSPPANFVRQFVSSVGDAHETTPPWQNPILRRDVDGNGQVTLNDLVLLVQALRARGNPHDLPAKGAPGEQPPLYLDVDGDGRASLADLIDVVQQLRDELNGE